MSGNMKIGVVRIYQGIMKLFYVNGLMVF